MDGTYLVRKTIMIQVLSYRIPTGRPRPRRHAGERGAGRQKAHNALASSTPANVVKVGPYLLHFNTNPFVQRVKPGIAAHFSGIEKALSCDFLPPLFGEPLDEENDHRRSLAGLPVKHAGIAIPDPTTTATEYYEASTLVYSHLIEAIRGWVPFQHADHLSVRRASIQQLRSRKKTKHDQELATLLADIRCHTRRQIETDKETGAWLTVLPSTINGTELSAQACQPPDLPETCDGCGHTNSVGRALDCKTRRLVWKGSHSVSCTRRTFHLSRQWYQPNGLPPIHTQQSTCVEVQIQVE
jgi:hypothetical protein